MQDRAKSSGPRSLDLMELETYLVWMQQNAVNEGWSNAWLSALPFEEWFDSVLAAS
jgi:hypothetical protein